MMSDSTRTQAISAIASLPVGGASEAPPAIISIFRGAQLNEVSENMINGSSGCGKRNDTRKIGVDTLPVLPRDATDRNRTSPFAFTGNKFEFRAPGSALSLIHI